MEGENMDLPIELKSASEKLVVGYKQAQLKKIAQDLSDRYRNESGVGKVLLSKDIEAAVYALVRMPATYGAVSDALKPSTLMVAISRMRSVMLMLVRLYRTINARAAAQMTTTITI